MSDSNDVGYFSVELDRLQLSFRTPFEGDLILRVEVEIENAAPDVKWDDGSGSPIFRIEDAKPLLQPTKQEMILEGNKEDSISVYVLDLKNMYKRSTYIPLNNDSLEVLANTSITVKVYNIKARKAELAPVDTKKGAPVPPPIVDEVITELSLPVSSLMTVRGSAIKGDHCFDPQLLADNNPGLNMTVKVNENETEFVGGESSLSWRLAGDNDLAEYVMGCNIMNWGTVEFLAPNVAWGLHAPDVPVPKVKVQPPP